MNSAVIRGVAPPRGPKLFEFCIPEDLPVSLSPKVGVINPGQVSAFLRKWHCYFSIVH